MITLLSWVPHWTGKLFLMFGQLTRAKGQVTSNK